MPSKYESEIEEILRKTGDVEKRPSLPRRARQVFQRLRRRAGSETRGAFHVVTPTRVGGVGAIVLIVGLAMRSGFVIIAGLALLLGAYLLTITRGRRTFEETTAYDKSWRGRPLHTSSSRSGRLRRWFRKKD